MAFKIKDGVRVGTVDVFNNAGTLLVNAPTATTAGKVANALTVGTGLTLSSGTTFDGSSALTISHTDTSTATTLTASGRTYVTGLTFDTFGHVTGYTTATETVTDTNTTYSQSAETTTGGAFLRLTGSDASTDDVKIASGTGITVTRTDANTITIDNTASGVTYDISAQTGGKLRLTSSTAVTDDVTFAGAGIASVATTDANTITITATEADTLQTVTGRGASSNVATITLSGGTASSTTGTGTLVVTGGVGISGAINIGGNAAIGGDLTLTGNLTVNGTTTTVNSTTITVDDKNIELGSVGTPTDTTADGGGITLKGATDKTFNWINSTASWTSSENLAVAAGKTLRVSGGTSGTAIITAAAAAGSPTLTLPTTTGTFALTSDINNGTLSASAGTAGSTNTTVALNFSGSYSANTASNITVNPVVGPALTNLASTMTGAGTGFLRKNGADTYTLDTSTYLTAEADTLQTVTTRGNSTNTGIVQQASATNIFARFAVAATVATVTADQVVDTWATATYRSAKYLVQITQGSNYQVSEILVVFSGTTTYMTEFAVIETNGALATFTSAVNGSNVELRVTMGSATSAVFKIEKTVMYI